MADTAAGATAETRRPRRSWGCECHSAQQPPALQREREAGQDCGYSEPVQEEKIKRDLAKERVNAASGIWPHQRDKTGSSLCRDLLRDDQWDILPPV